LVDEGDFLDGRPIAGCPSGAPALRFSKDTS